MDELGNDWCQTESGSDPYPFWIRPAVRVDSNMDTVVADLLQSIWISDTVPLTAFNDWNAICEHIAEHETLRTQAVCSCI